MRHAALTFSIANLPNVVTNLTFLRTTTFISEEVSYHFSKQYLFVKMSEADSKPISDSNEKKISMEELKQHNSHEDLWLLIDGKGRFAIGVAVAAATMLT